jgi:hypothetical protein
MKKHSGKIMFIAYILLSSAFIALDYTITESANIFLNVFLISTLLSLFLVTVRMFFEILIIKASDYFSQKAFSFGEIIRVAISSLFFPIIITFLAITFQFFVIKGESPYFQIVVLVVCEAIYLFLLMYKLNKMRISKVANKTMAAYMIVYLGYQAYNISLMVSGGVNFV